LILRIYALSLWKKRKDGVHFLTDISDKDELEEIRKKANSLDEDENLLPCCKTI
jgi:hypothetical protein